MRSCARWKEGMCCHKVFCKAKHACCANWLTLKGYLARCSARACSRQDRYQVTAMSGAMAVYCGDMPSKAKHSCHAPWLTLRGDLLMRPARALSREDLPAPGGPRRRVVRPGRRMPLTSSKMVKRVLVSFISPTFASVLCTHGRAKNADMPDESDYGMVCQGMQRVSVLSSVVAQQLCVAAIEMLTAGCQ